jgi:antitoxin (DNA-binding transcriptional repressor) of toxin-antitoxin stability system
MRRVRISELKSRLSEHLRAAEAGEAIEVLDRNRTIARVGPAGRAAGDLELIPAQRPFASVRDSRHRSARLRFDSLAALREERGSR